MAGDRCGVFKFLCRSADRKYLMRFKSETSIFNFWRQVVSILMTSPFSDSIFFSVHTRKQRFQNASFSNRSTLESVFEWLRFR